MGQRRTKNTDTKTRTKGQAVFEYLLMVFVIILIITAMARILFKPMNDFIAGMTGTYVTCLLETGELPTLGAEGGTAECRPPIFSPTTVENKDGPESSANNLANDRESKTPFDSQSSSNPGNAVAPPRNAIGKILRGGDGGGAGNLRSKQIDVSNEFVAGNGFFKSNSSGRDSRGRSNKTREIAGREYEQLQKDIRGFPVRKQSSDISKGAERAAKKIAVVPPETKLKDVEIPSSGLNISQIIRYFMIAAIFIIIFLLLGGQALQLSRGWEKE